MSDVKEEYSQEDVHDETIDTPHIPMDTNIEQPQEEEQQQDVHEDDVETPVITIEASTNQPTASTNMSTLRSGRWFPEEEKYALRLLAEFKKGTLPLPEKMTLREFLSLIFHCPPMRITKKFDGRNMLGKISYKRKDNLSMQAWWEIKELERKFWDRMVKSKSPSAFFAHAKMVEYSAQVFRDVPDLSDFQPTMPTIESQMQLGGDLDMDQLQTMFVQLQQKVYHMFGDKKTQQCIESALANVQTLEKMLKQSQQKLVDYEAMSEMPNVATSEISKNMPHDMKALVDSAKFHTKMEIDEIETLLDEAKDTQEQQLSSNKERSRNFNMATANMLTLQQMLNDSIHKLFRMEYRLSEVLEKGQDAYDSVKILAESVQAAKKDIKELERQLLKMNADIHQKYKESEYC